MAKGDKNFITAGNSRLWESVKGQYIRIIVDMGLLSPEGVYMYILEFIGYCGEVIAKETISAESYDKARQIGANRLYQCPEMWGVNVLISDRK